MKSGTFIYIFSMFGRERGGRRYNSCTQGRFRLNNRYRKLEKTRHDEKGENKHNIPQNDANPTTCAGRGIYHPRRPPPGLQVGRSKYQDCANGLRWSCLETATFGRYSLSCQLWRKEARSCCDCNVWPSCQRCVGVGIGEEYV